MDLDKCPCGRTKAFISGPCERNDCPLLIPSERVPTSHGSAAVTSGFSATYEPTYKVVPPDKRETLAAKYEKQGWIDINYDDARGDITHVICFEGEGAEVMFCRGWDDCREQFFNGIFGDGHHDWDEEQVKAWDADFADDDNWTHDEDRRRYCFASDVGEISKVRIYEVSPNT